MKINIQKGGHIVAIVFKSSMVIELTVFRSNTIIR
jgi:hypothetical protein